MCVCGCFFERSRIVVDPRRGSSLAARCSRGYGTSVVYKYRPFRNLNRHTHCLRDRGLYPPTRPPPFGYNWRSQFLYATTTVFDARHPGNAKFGHKLPQNVPFLRFRTVRGLNGVSIGCAAAKNAPETPHLAVCAITPRSIWGWTSIS